ncbi:MAG: hypothetical protein GX220_09225 [Treponema sp.]|nr:hypothetical protein [Treponema sp.]
MIENNYCGFKLIDKTLLENYKSVGLYLVHEKTGLEVFHMLNDDSENLFSFAFKTLPKDNTGVTHILEHSVLCGSKNFPLKDPFNQLNKQSVNTFLNAMTFPDKTVYPASSTVEADYFNLFKVYGDAVFFPLLEKNIFLQEGHRIDFNEKDKPIIQGVVYNEMKGALSSINRIISSASTKSLMPNTAYSFQSGGDPDFIPELTYEQFIEYHKTHYAPNNCRLFLYGNIPTEKQLDFIQENFLEPFENSQEKITANKKAKIVSCEDVAFEEFSKPIYQEIAIPSPAENHVVVNWRLDKCDNVENFMEYVFLSEIIMGNEGSPLPAALLKSGLGTDLSPASGIENELRNGIVSIGLRGVKKENAKKVEQLVLDTIDNLVKNGISEDDLKAAIMSRDFAEREITRAGNAPFALTLMRRCLRSWLWGKHPADILFNREAFAKIKEKLEKTNGKWAQDTLEKLFLKNKNRSLIFFYADKKVNKNHEKCEKVNIIKALKVSKDKIKKQIKDFNEFQNLTDNEEKLNLIPYLKIDDLPKDVKKIPLEEKKIGNVPFLCTEQPTNGIVNLYIYMPVDVIAPEDFPFMSFYAPIMTNVGFGGKNWEEAMRYTAGLTGKFFSTKINLSISKSKLKKTNALNLNDEKFTNFLYKKDKIIGRKWLVFQVSFLEENADKVVPMLFEAIRTPDFSDEKRIEILSKEFQNEFFNSFASNGSNYVSLRSAAKFSRDNAIDEIWDGLSVLNLVKQMSKMNATELSQKLQEIFQKLQGNGMMICAVGEKKNLDNMENILMPFVKDENVLAKPYECEDKRFFELLKITDNDYNHQIIDNNIEMFETNVRSGFANMSILCDKNVHLTNKTHNIACRYLSNGVLWEKVRMNGGAYGAWAVFDEVNEDLNLTSYRDPNPVATLDIFCEILSEMSKTEISQSEFEKTVTGAYGRMRMPLSPVTEGKNEIIRRLSDISYDDRVSEWNDFFETKPQDLIEAFKLYNKKSKNAKSAIIFNNFEKNSGKIINLSL